jgi:glutamyl-tRNA reductase
MRVSVMMDANGSNTTAAAAVLRARRHVPLASSVAVVLGGTGPVGVRVAELLALEGAVVRVGSRSVERAGEACETIAGRLGAERLEGVTLEAVATGDAESVSSALSGASTVIAAGTTGVQLVSAETLAAAKDIQVAIDLNAVPPLGIEGVEMTDKAVEARGVVRYGAIGVGGTKMQIHTAALKRLFDSNDQVLDTEAIYRIGELLES